MQATFTIAEPELVGARALREWITGQREQYARVFLVEGLEATAVVAETAAADDVILVPEGGEPSDGPATEVPYSGALREVGDELFLGDRGVELQDYIAAEFVQIVGPTAVSVVDADSRRAFLDDAALARRTGVFPSALLDPRILLANRSALVDPRMQEIPSALRVDADGRVSVGLRGEVLGTVDRLRELIAVPRPRAVALGEGAPSGTSPGGGDGGSRGDDGDGRDHREDLGRYLAATDLLKMLRGRTDGVRICGFGWTALDDDRADAEPVTADPFLLDTPEGFVLADPVTLRRRLLSPATACVVAAVQTSRAPEIADERVSRELGVPASTARTLCREAVAALDVHHGRAEVGTPTTDAAR